MSQRTARRVVAAAVVLLSVLPGATAAPKEEAAPTKTGPVLSTGIAGTARYGGDEWVHQDFVYDDEEEADNAADVVEVRVRREDDDLVVGMVLNTLRPSDATVVGLAIGRPDGESAPWPNGAAVASPWDRFVTVVPGKGTAVVTIAPAGVGSQPRADRRRRHVAPHRGRELSNGGAEGGVTPCRLRSEPPTA